jgi:hypothetical protein
MRPTRSTCARLLKAREDLTDSERHDLAQVLAHWSRSEEHARRIVMALPERPTAIDIRRTAAHIRPPSSAKRARQGCPDCFGSGFSVRMRPDGYTEAQPCRCVVEQADLLLPTPEQVSNSQGLS